MARAEMILCFRTRGMWRARLAALIGSERVFAWAVRSLRIQYRSNRRWQDSGARATYVPATKRIDLA